MRSIVVLGLITAIVQQLLAQPLAFPGAEGGGRYTCGGRGGRVIYVTNLNDSGPGSLRHAIVQQGPRTVVFAVDGTIELQSNLVVNNVIVRYIRARLGDIHQIEDDAMGAMNVKNLIIDHCSASWSVDECLSVYKSENITVQWCMVTHSLAQSAHSKGAHGFGGIWGGSNASFHHNLIAHHTSRNPRFASDGFGPVDFRNNVVYNWGFKSAYGGGRNGRINFVSNYYKPGPATQANKRATFYDPAEDQTTSLFMNNNTMEGNDSVTNNNWLGVGFVHIKKEIAAFDTAPINEEHPQVAFEKVIKYAGCSLHRDAYDERIANEVRSGTIDDGYFLRKEKLGIIDSQEEVGGWPALKSGTPPADSDSDGIPNWWEEQNKLNPQNGADGNEYTFSKNYTNLEVYLHSILEGETAPIFKLNKKTDTQQIQGYLQNKISQFSIHFVVKGRKLKTSGFHYGECAPIFDKEAQANVFTKRHSIDGWIQHCNTPFILANLPENLSPMPNPLRAVFQTINYE
jgi:hypothetical protein